MLEFKLTHVREMPPSKHELLINTKVGFSFQVPNYNAWLYFVTTGRNIHSVLYISVGIDFYSVQNIHI